MGVTVSVTGLDALPRPAVVDALEGEREKVPAGFRIVRVVTEEVLA